MAESKEIRYEQISFFPEFSEKEVIQTEKECFLEKFHRDVQFLNAIREEFLQYKERQNSAFLAHVTRNYLQFVKEYFMDTHVIYEQKELLIKQEDYRLLGKLFYFYLLYFKEQDKTSPFFEKMEEFISQSSSLKTELKSKPQKTKKEQQSIIEEPVSNEQHFFGMPFLEYTKAQMELFFHMVFDFSKNASLSLKEGYGKNPEEIFKICEMILIYLSQHIYFISDKASREDYKVNDLEIIALENFVYSYTTHFRVRDSKLCLAKSILMKRVAVRANINDELKREKVLKTR